MLPAPANNEGPKFPVYVMVASVVGLCLPPLLLITGALGVYGYLRATKEPAWAPRKQVTQMTMAVSFAGLLIFIGLGLPNYKRYQARAKQFECRDQLASLYDAQRRFYEKEKRYTTSLAELVPAPMRGTQVLRLTAEGPLWTSGLPNAEYVGQGVDEVAHPTLSTKAIDEGIPQLIKLQLGIKGDCPACSVTMACAAELDGDPTLDVWTVSTVERVGANGEKIAGGMPWCESDDFSL